MEADYSMSVSLNFFFFFFFQVRDDWNGPTRAWWGNDGKTRDGRMSEGLEFWCLEA